jgi:hypothetical protein
MAVRRDDLVHGTNAAYVAGCVCKEYRKCLLERTARSRWRFDRGRARNDHPVAHDPEVQTTYRVMTARPLEMHRGSNGHHTSIDSRMNRQASTTCVG